MLVVYKPNMALNSFQHKRDVHVWSPHTSNIEITSTRQHLPDFKFKIYLRIDCQRKSVIQQKIEPGGSVTSKKKKKKTV